MEIVAIIIMLLVVFSLMLKMTYLPLWGRVAVCLVCALSVAFEWKAAANQSKTQISTWLQNPELMLDIAVLLTVDVFLQITFCIMNAKYISGEHMSKCEKAIRIVTLWVPGILIFPTLFSLLVEAIFTFTGFDFALIARILSAAVFATGLILPALLMWLVPERDLRLELIFMLNGLIALLGVVATVNGRTAVSGVNDVEWQALAGIILILIVGASIGFYLYKRKSKKHNLS